MKSYLTLLLLTLLLVTPAPLDHRVYLPLVAAALPPATVVDAYGEIDTYLNRRVEAARAEREASQPTREEFRRVLGLPPECLVGAAPELVEDVQVAVIEGVSIYAVVLEVCEGQFAVKGLLGKLATASNPQPLTIAIHGTSGSPSTLFGLKPEDYHHKFGLRLAQRGYTVFAPVVITAVSGPGLNHNEARNRLFKKGLVVGQNLMGIEVGQVVSMLDYLVTRPDVLPGRVGVYGISLGGELAAFLAAADERVQAVVVSGWVEDREGKLTNDNYPAALHLIENTDYNFTPAWLLHFDDIGLVRLIAPRALFVEVGDLDPRYQATLDLWPQIEAVYAGAPAGTLGLGVGHGGHEIYFGEAAEWLDQQLK